MATNKYFRPFTFGRQQDLAEDLIVQSIKIYGIDVKYMPRTLVNPDALLGEDVSSAFNDAIDIEMYIKNTQGFEGEGDFLSKFNLEIRDSITFVMARKRWEQVSNEKLLTEVGYNIQLEDANTNEWGNSNALRLEAGESELYQTIHSRPYEGDWIYFPLNKKLYEIKFVENELLFKSFGNREAYIYEMRCETFRFSNENIETGDEEVDDIELLASYTVRLQLGAGSGNYHLGEMVYQGANLTSSSISAKVRTWDPVNKTLDVINTKGEFVTSNAVVGHDSTASYAIATKDDLADVVIDDDSDNRVIQQEASTFVDLSEINPFGVP